MRNARAKLSTLDTAHKLPLSLESIIPRPGKTHSPQKQSQMVVTGYAIKPYQQDKPQKTRHMRQASDLGHSPQPHSLERAIPRQTKTHSSHKRPQMAIIDYVTEAHQQDKPWKARRVRAKLSTLDTAHKPPLPLPPSS